MIDLTNYRLGTELCELRGINKNAIYSWNIPEENIVFFGLTRFYHLDDISKMRTSKKFLDIWDRSTDLTGYLPTNEFASLINIYPTAFDAIVRRDPTMFDKKRVGLKSYYKVPQQIIDLIDQGFNVNMLMKSDDISDYKNIVLIHNRKYGIY